MTKDCAILLVSISLAGVALASCRTKSPRCQVVPTNYAAFLSQEELQQVSERAQNGDEDAAFRLYQYYSQVKLDRSKALKWLIVAADHNHVVAQYDLGMLYSGKVYADLRDREKSEYWFRKAAENGDADASRKLQIMETDGVGGE